MGRGTAPEDVKVTAPQCLLHRHMLTESSIPKNSTLLQVSQAHTDSFCVTKQKDSGLD